MFDAYSNFARSDFIFGLRCFRTALNATSEMLRVYNMLLWLTFNELYVRSIEKKFQRKQSIRSYLFADIILFSSHTLATAIFSIQLFLSWYYFPQWLISVPFFCLHFCFIYLTFSPKLYFIYVQLWILIVYLLLRNMSFNLLDKNSC